MKTLKKVLCLVLALVMVVGTMAISAAAFDDDDEINDKYAEAVAVLAANKVIEGFEDKFSPKDTLTRAQGIAIVTRALLTRKTADNLNSSAAPFEDVSGNNAWAAGVVAYGVQEGMVSGWNGKFDPAGALTGYAYAKFLLTALGVEGTYTGNNWENNVLLAATEAKLLDGMEDSFKLADPITREQAAQLTFNAATKDIATTDTGKYNVMNGSTVVSTANSYYEAFMIADNLNDKAKVAAEATVVADYDPKDATEAQIIAALAGQSYTEDQLASVKTNIAAGTGDGPLVTAARAALPAIMRADAITAAANTYSAEADKAAVGKTFKGVTYTKAAAKTDAFGRVSMVTKVGKKTVYTAAAEPVATYSNASTKIGKIAADLGAPAANNADGDDPYSFTVITDGVSAAAVTSYKNQVSDPVGSKGALVEVYKVDDGVYTIVVVNPKVAYLTNTMITKAKAATSTKDAEPRYITVNGADYVTDDFAAGDVLVYTMGNDAKIATIVKAETVSGKITRSTSNGVYTIDGQTYTKSFAFNATLATGFEDLGRKEGTFYLDSFNNIVAHKPTQAAAAPYGVVLNYSQGLSQNANGTYRTVNFAQIVKTDGTIEELTVTNGVKSGDDGYIREGTVVTYAYNNATANYTLSAAAADNNKTFTADAVEKTNIVNVTGSGESVTKTHVTYANANTKFVIVTGYGTPAANVKVVTGAANIGNYSGKLFTIDTASTADSVADIVYIVGGSASVSDSYIYFTGKYVDETDEKGVTTRT